MIDDREDLGIMWTKKGGTFVYHTSTAKSLAELENLGVFASSKVEDEVEDHEGESEKQSADC